MGIAQELKVFAKHQKILVVEDDDELRKELVEMMKIFYSDVKEASDGAKGWSLYRKERFDVVLTDITMPNMNGIELSTEIKNINRDQNIVVLSAHSDVEFMIKLIDIGISQFVAKPFESSSLLYRLLKVSENIMLKNEFERMKKLTKIELIKGTQDQNNDHLKDKSKDYKEVVDQSVSIETPKKAPVVNDVSKDLNKNLGHVQKNAESFMESLQGDDELWLAFESELDEMMELDEDFQYYIDKFYLNSVTNDDINSIAGIVGSFYRIFLIVDELKLMAHAMFELSDLLKNIDIDLLSKEKIDKLKILEFIHDDISRFIQTVFVYQDTVDIHYLEDSLISSVEQIKINVTEEEFEEEELELF